MIVDLNILKRNETVEVYVKGEWIKKLSAKEAINY
jgi:hypothetical protein